MSIFTQDELNITIDTSLGKDVLLVSAINGSEAISRLFRFELSLVSENQGIVFKEIIGKNVTVAFMLPSGAKKYLNGIISSFAQESGAGTASDDTRVSNYRATMVPWLWLLTRSAESRIFQNMSVPDIVEQVFTDHGFSDFKFKLQGNYDKRIYCVQYRETHFNFISRLIEEEGIHYFFEHINGKHMLILADAPQYNVSCPEQKSASYSIETSLSDDFITSIEKLMEIRSSKYSLNDYNFEMPNTSLIANLPAKEKLWQKDLELYDSPGEYSKKAEGSRLVQIRMEEEEARITTITGCSTCKAFTSGYRFTLINVFRKDMNDKDYILTGIEHHASQNVQRGGDFTYENRFECIPADVPFRPERLTPKPTVQGSQTAIVVGPSGEEIYPDKYGRVKVQFHWDREGKKDEKSSCWVRVSTIWAGNQWGSLFIPRIGQEVVVDFLEGDPDNPIITGMVYNALNMPPYSLPAEKTKSTIKSDSSMGGGGFNEIRFEDKKGSEEIFLHGQKDWTIAILNDKNQTVGHNETLAVTNNRTKTVGVDQSETIGSNKKIQVGANHTESIGVNKDVKVGANQTEAIGANMSITVGANKTETVTINTAETIGVAKELTIGGLYQITVGAAMNETVGAAKAEEIGAAKSVNVGANSSENIGVNKSVQAGSNISESAGKDVSSTAGKKMILTSGDDFGISGGKKGVIEIADQLTIKCGDASITMKKNGDITIKGKTINVKGSGNIVMKASKILEN